MGNFQVYKSMADTTGGPSFTVFKCILYASELNPMIFPLARPLFYYPLSDTAEAVYWGNLIKKQARNM